MTEIQVIYFLEVAKSFNMTHVANKYYVSQPAISKQIDALENELNCKLFQRVNSKLMLTECGKLYLNCFEETAQKLNEVATIAKQIENDQNHTIRLAALDGWDMQFLSKAFGLFRQMYPNTTISLESRGFNGLYSSLIHKDLDLIIDIDKVAYDSKDYCAKYIAKMPQVLAYPSTWFADSDCCLSLSDFRSSTFFVLPSTEAPAGVRIVMDYCSKTGFTPKIRIAPNINSKLMCVASGLGVAILDKWTMPYKGIDFFCLSKSHSIRCVWRRKTQTPEMLDLIKIISETISESLCDSNAANQA